ncbi:MAG: hypothetical protein Q8Q33_02890 [Chlamydiota bacterium]|nr:hypothetical protein [Chlamydiota bacterium]
MSTNFFRALNIAFILLIQMAAFSDTEIDVHIRKGISFAQDMQADKAIHEFNEALLIDPNHAEAHCMLGIELYKKAVPKRSENDLRKAIVELETAIRIDPELAIAHDVVAFAYYILGDFDRSNNHFLEAKRLGIHNKILEAKLKNAFKMINLKETMEEPQ